LFSSVPPPLPSSSSASSSSSTSSSSAPSTNANTGPQSVRHLRKTDQGTIERI
jgi:hypothetical protein